MIFLRKSLPFAYKNTFNVGFCKKIMHTQLIVVFISGCLALLGIRILISSFDDDDNDGDGMSYSTRDDYQFSILEVS